MLLEKLWWRSWKIFRVKSLYREKPWIMSAKIRLIFHCRLFRVICGIKCPSLSAYNLCYRYWCCSNCLYCILAVLCSMNLKSLVYQAHISWFFPYADCHSASIYNLVFHYLFTWAASEAHRSLLLVFFVFHINHSCSNYF